MTATGWTGEPPEDDVLRAAPGGFASFIASARPDPGEGRTLEQVLGRSLRPDKPEVHRDPDEVAANLMARGYAPGQLSDLSRRLGDAQAELGEEQEKIERGRKRQERIMRDHQAGKITVFDIARMQDFDEGDLDRAARLERRVANLRRQLKEAAALISPQREAPADPFEGASRRAHDAFVEVTRAAMGAARRTPAPGSSSPRRQVP